MNATTNTTCSQSFKLRDFTAEDRENSRMETAKMSYCFALKNTSYIVLASDSRSSFTPDATLTRTSYSDGFEKIVYLPKAEIAFITAGRNIFKDRPITDYLRSLEPELIGKSAAKALVYVDEQLRPMLQDNDIVNLLAVKGLDAHYCDIKKEKEFNCLPLDATWRTHSQKGFWVCILMTTTTFQFLLPLCIYPK